MKEITLDEIWKQLEDEEYAKRYFNPKTKGFFGIEETYYFKYKGEYFLVESSKKCGDTITYWITKVVENGKFFTLDIDGTSLEDAKATIRQYILNKEKEYDRRIN
jgi:hypothetical protein